MKTRKAPVTGPSLIVRLLQEGKTSGTWLQAEKHQFYTDLNRKGNKDRGIDGGLGRSFAAETRHNLVKLAFGIQGDLACPNRVEDIYALAEAFDPAKSLVAGIHKNTNKYAICLASILLCWDNYFLSNNGERFYYSGKTTTACFLNTLYLAIEELNKLYQQGEFKDHAESKKVVELLYVKSHDIQEMLLTTDEEINKIDEFMNKPERIYRRARSREEKQEEKYEEKYGESYYPALSLATIKEEEYSDLNTPRSSGVSAIHFHSQNSGQLFFEEKSQSKKDDQAEIELSLSHVNFNY